MDLVIFKMGLLKSHVSTTALTAYHKTYRMLLVGSIPDTFCRHALRELLYNQRNTAVVIFLQHTKSGLSHLQDGGSQITRKYYMADSYHKTYRMLSVDSIPDTFCRHALRWGFSRWGFLNHVQVLQG